MNLSKVVHYFAVLGGFLASAFFMFFLILDGSFYLIEGKFSVIPILLLMMFTVGGYVMEILNPGKGCWLMIAGGLIMAVYLLMIGGISEFQMALIFGLPFIIPGGLFYYLSKKAV